MSLLVLYIIVFLVGATPFLESTFIIPVGALAGLNVWSVLIISLIGNLITLLLSITLAEQIKKGWGKRRKRGKKRKKDKSEKAAELWNKYGLPGLAIIHPVTIGSSHATVIIALSLGSSKKSVTLWMAGSVIVWASAFAVLSFLGADFLYSRIESDGFLNDLIDRK